VAVIDRIKWDGSPDVFAWKFPSEELATWSQLIVNESQEAFLVRGGVYEGPFPAGRHTLETENLPLLRGVLGIPYGGKSPFSAEVWFVNRVTNLALLWGTAEPIQLQDPKYNILVPVRANGQYGIRISDPKKFLLKLVGTLRVFDANNVKTYFAGVLGSRINQEIASAIVSRRISVLEASAYIDELSNQMRAALVPVFDDYGINLTQFNIRSINLPEEDPSVKKLKKALSERAELDILGTNFQQASSFGVLNTAAGNQGIAGTVMGAGMGLGIGAGIGGGLGQSMSTIANVMSTSTPAPSVDSNNPPPLNSAEILLEKLSAVEKLAEARDKGVLTDEEFSKLKNQILGLE
jgi:membrane protease subunit (stomatin/prohibitin family)